MKFYSRTKGYKVNLLCAMFGWKRQIGGLRFVVNVASLIVRVHVLRI